MLKIKERILVDPKLTPSELKKIGVSYSLQIFIDDFDITEIIFDERLDNLTAPSKREVVSVLKSDIDNHLKDKTIETVKGFDSLITAMDSRKSRRENNYTVEAKVLLLGRLFQEILIVYHKKDKRLELKIGNDVIYTSFPKQVGWETTYENILLLILPDGDFRRSVEKRKGGK